MAVTVLSMTEVFEPIEGERVVALSLARKINSCAGEGKVLLLSSGMTAVLEIVMTLARSGDEIVCSTSVRPEVLKIFNGILRDIGISVQFVSSNDPGEYENMISYQTRLLFVDLTDINKTPALNLEGIAETAHTNRIPLIVDASCIKPSTYRALEHGADIEFRDFSAISDDESVRGASIIDSGKFDWRVSNVPLIKACDPCCEDIRWAFDLNKEKAPYAFAYRLTNAICRVLSTELSEIRSQRILDELNW